MVRIGVVGRRADCSKINSHGLLAASSKTEVTILTDHGELGWFIDVTVAAFMSAYGFWLVGWRQNDLCSSLKSINQFIPSLGHTNLSLSLKGSRKASCPKRALVIQISKTLAGADKKDLIEKLPKFIYDEEKSLEKQCQKLAEKIEQLNFAIDNVSTQLRSDDPPNGAAINSDEVES
ncbi:uncharacterized protein LOC111392273, partial [Olea europaea subsp. europaea]